MKKSLILAVAGTLLATALPAAAQSVRIDRDGGVHVVRDHGRHLSPREVRRIERQKREWRRDHARRYERHLSPREVRRIERERRMERAHRRMERERYGYYR
ncbi:hypothetical protein [Aureimonas sp. ME7]|uniref:hypothetical protein n=1 Tax=Aureimonas sp. ME7 TaxID=2744252 RepID=UPI0015F69FD9|nr:hypothetical protein [Aureimonas sp. ME7]